MQKITEAKILAQTLEKLKKQRKPSAMLTIIKKKGSSYRSEGSKFLVTEDQTQVCGISGGCLEKGLLHTALKVIKTEEPVIEHADLKDPFTWGMWLGCPGEVEILIEPVKYDKILDKWIECIQKEERFVLVKNVKNLDTAIYTKDQQIGKPIGDINLINKKLENIKEKPELIGSIFYDKVLMYPPIVLFGKGEERYFFEKYGEILGFKVLNLEPTQKVTIPQDSFVVIANHHLKLDKISLEKALNSKARYIGLISSLKRFEKLSQGLPIDERVYVPAGLDIGGESPDEVVLSIICEIISIFNKGTNEHLAKIKGLLNYS
ncbi:MAG: XdhC family protein [Aquificae bacterium]|nr:XdhC family protein [Aquificota bacterium]